MCNPKPGNRCSTHARQELISINQQIAAKQAEIDEFGQKIDDYRQTKMKELEGSKQNNINDIYEYGHEESNDLSREMDKLKTAKANAELVYNTTPDGIKSLEQLTAVSGNAVHMKEFSTSRYFADHEIAHSNYPTKIVIPMSVKQRNNNVLQESLHQKEWQSDVLKVLKENEAIAPEKAVFIAQAFKEYIEKQHKETSNEMLRLYSQQDDALYKYARTPSEEYRKTINKAEMEIETKKIRLAYLDMRKNDLTSYIKTAEKKISVPELV